MIANPFLWTFLLLYAPSLAMAQQHPIAAETPNLLPDGTLRVLAGIGYFRDQSFPLSGLEGNLLRLGRLEFRFAGGELIELKLEGILYNRLAVKQYHHPYLSIKRRTQTSDVDDMIVWTKIRFTDEESSPISSALRFGVQLPNASNESGLGLDEFSFYSSLLLEKHLLGICAVTNVGLGIIGDPLIPNQQNDFLIYAFGGSIPLWTSTSAFLESAGRVGHQSYGIYRLANARFGMLTEGFGFYWTVCGIISFVPSDHSQGIELTVSHDFLIHKPDH